MEDNERVIARLLIGGNDLLTLQTALSKMIESARFASGGKFDGASVMHVEDACGLRPHSVELIEETLTDGSKVYNVCLLFEGDVRS